MNLLRSYPFFTALPIILNFLVSSPNFFVNGQGKPRSYSIQEKAAIDKLQTLVSDKLTLDYMKKDGYLLRWIRSYEFDIGKAHQQLEKSLKWRKQNNMDNILESDTGASKRDLLYNYNGVDREGHPVLLLYWGKWNLRKYIVAGNREEILSEYKRMVERAIRKAFEVAEKTGQDIDQFYALVELNGFNRREHLCVACLPLQGQTASIFDSSASVFVRNITTINTPRIFQPVLSLVKQIFGFLTLKNFNTYDSNKSEWQLALLKDIAPDQLPKSIGGAQ